MSRPAGPLPTLSHLKGDSVIHRRDPRVRLATAFLLLIVMALMQQLPALAVALGVSIVLLASTRVAANKILLRLAPLNALLLFLWLLVPPAMPGHAAFSIGSIVWTVEGLHHVLRITIKANAIFITMLALLGTMNITTLGHALAHLKFPEKLIHLLFFTVRYIDVLGREFYRLRRSLAARAFRPGPDMHTCRTYGYLVGMLMIRSIDRAEKVVAAMKCRGWRGHYYLLHHFRLNNSDFIFAAGGLCLAGGLIFLETS